jgi:hypothetical protein
MTVRPLYETAQDLAHEAEIIEAVVSGLGYDHALKLSRAYGLDWALVRGGRVGGYAEVKDRDLAFGVPGGYYIALLKSMAARVITATTGRPCWLVVRFSDGGVRIADFRAAINSAVVEHGRTDRGDPHDIEPCAAIPWEAFEPL